MEFNDSLHVSPRRRYDLSAPDDPPSSSAIDEDRPPASDDTEKAVIMLRDAAADLAADRITTNDYHNLEDAVKRGPAFHPHLQYATLRKKLSQKLEQIHPSNENIEDPQGYLTPEHEAEYYLAMDARLGDESAVLQMSRAPGKPSFADREREAAMRNPASVYNWLRRNQPHFLQDHENTSEKSGPKASNQRSSKKASARKEGEPYDEDTASMEAGPTSNPKNKRKRDDDTGYRPKGGSSRGNRKKKDDGTSNSRRASKRASGTGA